jgi:hypothetical protein
VRSRIDTALKFDGKALAGLAQEIGIARGTVIGIRDGQGVRGKTAAKLAAWMARS